MRLSKKSFLLPAVAAGALTFLPAATCTQQDKNLINSAISQELSCVSAAAVSGGLSDPAEIVAYCGVLGVQIAASDVVAIVESLAASQDALDAGLADAGTLVLNDASIPVKALRPVTSFTPQEIAIFKNLVIQWSKPTASKK
jgi:hypothetical protein